MFMKRYLTIFIATILIMVPVLQSQAVMIRGLRFDSKADGTRIVLDLDGTALYRTQYDKEPSISIRLLETKRGSIKQTTSIDDGLVKAVTAKEKIVNDTAETMVRILLKKSATSTVFSLSNRIVIDITPDEIIGTTDVAAENENAPMEDREITMEDVVAEATQPLNVPAEGITPLPHERVQESNSYKTIFSLLAERSALTQLGFNGVFMLALIFMGIKVWRVARVSKKNSNILKKGQNFADMIGRLQRGAEAENNGAGKRRPIFAVPNMAQKKQKKKKRTLPPVASQKQYERVHKLAQLGIDRLAISQQSNVPIGEVNLILNLTKSRSQSKAN